MRVSVTLLRRLVAPVLYSSMLALFLYMVAIGLSRSQFNLISCIKFPITGGIPLNLTELQAIDHGNISDIFNAKSQPRLNHHIAPLLHCPTKLNPVTNAIRLPNPIINISLTPPNSSPDPSYQYFNPTLIPLPATAPHQYLLLSRLVTAGLHQESHICFATICQPRNQSLSAGNRYCNDTDHELLGPQGGIHCVTAPERLNISPTPALHCEGAWSAFPDIPGFHDPRMFWSGSDEPLVIVNSGSRYACVGLWVVDLRVVYHELSDVLKGSRDGRMNYPYLTELTRNPRKDRATVEKNWILFFPRRGESWVQYDLVIHGKGKEVESATLIPTVEYSKDEKYINTPNTSLSTIHGNSVLDVIGTASKPNTTNTTHLDRHPKRTVSLISISTPQLIPSRTLAKLIGSGYTTSNLTSSHEHPCLSSSTLLDSLGNQGHWHQGSNSLRLILCSRSNTSCHSAENGLINDGKIVHFAVLHRKFSNDLDLPMRYERYFMVWEARMPFRMVGISRFPVLFGRERGRPWSDLENGLDDNSEINGDGMAGVYFTYTPSLAWAWRRGDRGGKEDLGTGYLGDEVLVGVGMDDKSQGVVRVKVGDLLGCLRLCPDFEG